MLGSLVSLSHMLYTQYMIIYPSPAAPMIRREGGIKQDKTSKIPGFYRLRYVQHIRKHFLVCRIR